MSDFGLKSPDKIRCEGSFETCPICLTQSEVGAVLVPCGHRFCVACCTTYLRSNSDTHSAPCPVCRVEARLCDVVTPSGENLRQTQILSRRKSFSYFDLNVRVQTVAFGDSRNARHPSGEQALTPSAKTPDVWEIMDSCSFYIQATTTGLSPGPHDVSLHVKRVDNFRCKEKVVATVTIDDQNKFINLLDFNTLAPNAWTLLHIDTVYLDHRHSGFRVCIEADQTDWWKSGLIVDCIAVKHLTPEEEAAISHSQRRKRKQKKAKSCNLS